MIQLTLKEILTDEKYKRMSDKELFPIIGRELRYEDYISLHGKTVQQKLEHLKQKLEVPVISKRKDLYYGEHLSLNQIEKILIDMQDEESEAPISFESRLNIMTTLRSIVKEKLTQKDLH